MPRLPQRPRATARCCRSCTSTATRSPADRPRAGQRRGRHRLPAPGRAGTRSSSRATTRQRVQPTCTRDARRRCARAHPRDPAPTPVAGDGPVGRGPVAGDRAAHAQGLDRPGRGRRRARSRAPSGPTRSRCPASGRTRSTWRCSRTGCAPTGPTSCSTPTVGSSRRLAALAPPATSGCRRRPYANGGRLLRAARRSRPPSGTPVEVAARRTTRTRTPGRSARCCATSTRRRHASRRRRQLPAVLPGRDGEQPARRRLRGHRPLPAGRGAAGPTTTSPPTAG